MTALKSNQFSLFVYGTLKPGEANYDRYCKDVLTVEAAMVRGQLYDLPLGYPALTPGNLWVSGFLLSFADFKVLSSLDELENYCPSRPALENEYIRTQVDTFDLAHKSLGLAWVYRMELSRIEALNGVLLPSGSWTSSARLG